MYNVKLNWKTVQVRPASQTARSGNQLIDIVVQTEQLAVYATAIVALRSLTTSVDRLHDIIHSLVGSRSSSTLDEHAEARAQRDVAMFTHA